MSFNNIVIQQRDRTSLNTFSIKIKVTCAETIQSMCMHLHDIGLASLTSVPHTQSYLFFFIPDSLSVGPENARQSLSRLFYTFQQFTDYFSVILTLHCHFGSQRMVILCRCRMTPRMHAKVKICQTHGHTPCVTRSLVNKYSRP